MPSRRHFLQWAGVGAAASLAAGHGFAGTAAQPDAQTDNTSLNRKYHLGVASYTFYKLSLDKAIEITKQVGLKYISLKDIHVPQNCTPERLAELLDKVKASGIVPYACGVVYMRTPKDVDQTFRFAKMAGFRLIVTAPTYDLLPLINEKVQEYDIPIAIHNHGPGDKLYPTPLMAYEMIKDMDRRMGLCVDIGYVVRSGLDVIDVVEKVANRMYDIHLKDVVKQGNEYVCVEVGRGVIDFPKLFRTLDKLGYSGIASFECEKNYDDPLSDLAESVGYARGVLAAI